MQPPQSFSRCCPPPPLPHLPSGRQRNSLGAETKLPSGPDMPRTCSDMPCVTSVPRPPRELTASPSQSRSSPSGSAGEGVLGSDDNLGL